MVGRPEHEDGQYVRRAAFLLVLRRSAEGIRFGEAMRQVAKMNSSSLYDEIQGIDRYLYDRLTKRKENSGKSRQSAKLDSCFAPWKQMHKNYEQFVKEYDEDVEIKQIANSLMDEMGDNIGNIDHNDNRFKTASKKVGFGPLHFKRVLMLMSVARHEPNDDMEGFVNSIFGNAVPRPHDENGAQVDDVGADAADADNNVRGGDDEQIEPADAEEDNNHEDEMNEFIPPDENGAQGDDAGADAAGDVRGEHIEPAAAEEDNNHEDEVGEFILPEENGAQGDGVGADAAGVVRGEHIEPAAAEEALAAIITRLRDENDTLNNRLEEANARWAGVPPAFVNRQIDDESLGSLVSEY